MVTSHHEKRLPLKKKSCVVLLYLAKKDPKPRTNAKYPKMIIQKNDEV
jgi:hypothetical protein